MSADGDTRSQGRIPGTETWKPINENPEAEEDVPGVMIIRLREDLYFANTAQLKGAFSPICWVKARC